MVQRGGHPEPARRERTTATARASGPGDFTPYRIEPVKPSFSFSSSYLIKSREGERKKYYL
jgi:hypothetical protein